MSFDHKEVWLGTYQTRNFVSRWRTDDAGLSGERRSLLDVPQ